MDFQYNVEAVCTSKLSQDLVLLSITRGIVCTADLYSTAAPATREMHNLTSGCPKLTRDVEVVGLIEYTLHSKSCRFKMLPVPLLVELRLVSEP